MKRMDVVRAGLTVAGFLVAVILALKLLAPVAARWLGVSP